jgi:transcription antitermination factor NusG
MRIVSLGKTPVPVTAEEIDSIRIVAGSGLAIDPWPFPGEGQRVVIERGPLSGLEGLVTGTGGSEHLVVSVTLLQRSIAVDIDRSWARCLPEILEADLRPQTHRWPAIDCQRIGPACLV